jgi:hypothetical protein
VELRPEEICDRLGSMDAANHMRIATDLRGCTLPTGTLHVRVFDSRDGAEICSVFSTSTTPMNLGSLAILFALHDRFTGSANLSLRPLPRRFASVLELVADFQSAIPAVTAQSHARPTCRIASNGRWGAPPFSSLVTAPFLRTHRADQVRWA